jgi:hypothetical protein
MIDLFLLEPCCCVLTNFSCGGHGHGAFLLANRRTPVQATWRAHGCCRGRQQVCGRDAAAARLAVEITARLTACACACAPCARMGAHAAAAPVGVVVVVFAVVSH